MADSKNKGKHIEAITQYFLDRVNRPESWKIL